MANSRFLRPFFSYLSRKTGDDRIPDPDSAEARQLPPREVAEVGIETIEAKLTEVEASIARLETRRAFDPVTFTGRLTLERLYRERDELDDAYTRVFGAYNPPALNGVPDTRLLCATKDCRNELSSSEEAWRHSGLCQDCWYVATGAVKPEPNRKPYITDGLESLVELLLARQGRRSEF